MSISPNMMKMKRKKKCLQYNNLQGFPINFYRTFINKKNEENINVTNN